MKPKAGKQNGFLKYKADIKKHINIASLSHVGRHGLVSVVLPVFNGEKYLAEAIGSVLAQTYTDFELIIVDDGSTDNGNKIASNFASLDSRIRLITHDKNKKLPAALNTGFAAASGEYYTWISCDNIMLPEFLEKMTSELTSNADAAMVYGNMRLIDENGDILRGTGWFEKPPLSGCVMLPRSADELNDVANNTIGAAFLYRANAAEIIGRYSEKRFGIEDYDYWMRMNEIFDIVHTSFCEPLYLYRFHSGSLTSRDDELKITENRPALMEFDKRRRKLITAALPRCRTAADLKVMLETIEKHERYNQIS